MDSTISLLLTLGSIIVTSVVAPAVLLLLKARVDRNEKAAERAERKEVADRAKEVAEQAEEAARLLASNTAKAAEATKILTEKVDVVHTLVNSNLTIATQKLREARQATLALMLKHEPKRVADAGALRIEIAELDAVLLDRLHQAKVVEEQQAAQARS